MRSSDRKVVDAIAPNRVLIIAEAGVNHNGDPALARRLVDAAAAAGADAVKFQTFIADELVRRDAPQAKHHAENVGEGLSHYEMLRRLELPFPVFGELQRQCAEREIIFLSTPYDCPSAEFLVTLGLAAYKVASSEFTNYPLLDILGRAGKPLILSCGMSGWDEIDRVIAYVRRFHVPLTLCQCTANYPVAYADVHLRVITALQARYPDVRIGFSDHSRGSEASFAAVALGARTIEKHLTLDRSLPGPDHRGSLEPEEFAGLVAGIRNVELALGDGDKRVLDAERTTRQAMRKSIVARQDLPAGTVLAADHLALKRPGTGLGPDDLPRVIGRTLNRAVAKDEAIADGMLA